MRGNDSVENTILAVLFVNCRSQSISWVLGLQSNPGYDRSTVCGGGFLVCIWSFEEKKKPSMGRLRVNHGVRAKYCTH